MLQTTVSGGGVPVTTMTKIENLPMFVDTKTFSLVSGLSVDTICKMCKQGEMAHKMVGRRYLINCKLALNQLNDESVKHMKKPTENAIETIKSSSVKKPKKRQLKQDDSVESTILRLKNMGHLIF